MHAQERHDGAVAPLQQHLQLPPQSGPGTRPLTTHCMPGLAQQLCTCQRCTLMQPTLTACAALKASASRPCASAARAAMHAAARFTCGDRRTDRRAAHIARGKWLLEKQCRRRQASVSGIG